MENPNVTLFETELYICITPLRSITDDFIDDFKEAVTKWCEHKEKHVILDLGNVCLLSSRAITNLIRLYKLQLSKNKLIAMVNLTTEIKRLLDSVNITKVIPVFKTTEEFLSSINSSDLHLASMTEAKITIDNLLGGLSIIQLDAKSESIDTSKTDFDKIFSQLKNTKILIDLENIINLDEKTITSFTSFADTINAKEGNIVLAGLNSVVIELFDLLGIDNKFQYADSIEAGIKLLSVIQDANNT